MLGVGLVFATAVWQWWRQVPPARSLVDVRLLLRGGSDLAEYCVHALTRMREHEGLGVGWLTVALPGGGCMTGPLCSVLHRRFAGVAACADIHSLPPAGAGVLVLCVDGPADIPPSLARLRAICRVAARHSTPAPPSTTRT